MSPATGCSVPQRLSVNNLNYLRQESAITDTFNTTIPVIISYRPRLRAIQASTVNNNNLVRPTIHRQLASHCPPTSSFVKMCLLNVRSLSNKTFICHDLILSSNTDFFMLTETWLRPGDNVPLNETCPSNFSYFNLPRPVKRGWGPGCIL